VPPPKDILLADPFTYASGKLRGTILGKVMSLKTLKHLDYRVIHISENYYIFLSLI